MARVRIACPLPHVLRPDERDADAAAVETFPHGPAGATKIRPGRSEEFAFEAGWWLVVRRLGSAPVDVTNVGRSRLMLKLRDAPDGFEATDALDPRQSRRLDARGEWSVRL